MAQRTTISNNSLSNNSLSHNTLNDIGLSDKIEIKADSYYAKEIIYSYRDEDDNRSYLKKIMYNNLLLNNNIELGLNSTISTYDYLNLTNTIQPFINAIDIHWNDPYCYPKTGEQPFYLGIQTTSDLLNYIKNSFTSNNTNDLVSKDTFDNEINTIISDIDDLNQEINKILNRKVSFIDEINNDSNINNIIDIIENGRKLKYDIINAPENPVNLSNIQEETVGHFICYYNCNDSNPTPYNKFKISFTDALGNNHIDQEIEFSNTNLEVENNYIKFTKNVTNNITWYSITIERDFIINFNVKFFNFTITPINNESECDAKLKISFSKDDINYPDNINNFKTYIVPCDIVTTDIMSNLINVYRSNNDKLISNFCYPDGIRIDSDSQEFKVIIYYVILVTYENNNVAIIVPNQSAYIVDNYRSHFDLFNEYFNYNIPNNKCYNYNSYTNHAASLYYTLSTFNVNTTNNPVTLSCDVKLELNEFISYINHKNNNPINENSITGFGLYNYNNTPKIKLDHNFNNIINSIYTDNIITTIESDTTYNMFNNPDSNTDFGKLTIIQEVATDQRQHLYIPGDLFKANVGYYGHAPYIVYKIDGCYYSFVLDSNFNTHFVKLLNFELNSENAGEHEYFGENVQKWGNVISGDTQEVHNARSFVYFDSIYHNDIYEEVDSITISPESFANGTYSLNIKCYVFFYYDTDFSRGSSYLDIYDIYDPKPESRWYCKEILNTNIDIKKTDIDTNNIIIFDDLPGLKNFSYNEYLNVEKSILNSTDMNIVYQHIGEDVTNDIKNNVKYSDIIFENTGRNFIGYSYNGYSNGHPDDLIYDDGMPFVLFLYLIYSTYQSTNVISIAY